jgi:parallel beta-helix repeat protein
MTLTVRSATVSGATTKGSALTHAELDENFNHLSQSSNHSFTPSGSGAVAETVESRGRWVVYVTDYMSVADRASLRAGSTVASSTAFSNAIATGYDVFVPKGNYSISEDIAMANAGQRIFGEGRLSKITHVGASADNVVTVTGNDCAVDALWLVGNGVDATTSLNGNIVMFQGVTGGRASGNICDTPAKNGKGIQLYASNEVSVAYNRIQNGEDQSKDISLEGNSNRNVIYKNWCLSANMIGIQMVAVPTGETQYYNRIIGNHIQAKTNAVNAGSAHGIALNNETASGGGVKYNVVEGNTISDCDGMGIYLAGSASTITTDNVVNGNVIESCVTVGTGTLVDGGIGSICERNIISNNQITGGGISSSSSGIRVSAADCLIIGNKVYSFDGTGIRASGARTHIKQNNIIVDGNFRGIYDESAADKLVEGNTVYYISGNGAGIGAHGTDTKVVGNTVKRSASTAANGYEVAGTGIRMHGNYSDNSTVPVSITGTGYLSDNDFTSAAQAIAAATDTITATAKIRLIANNTAGSITLTSAPTIADGFNGQTVILTNVGAQDVVIQDQGTLASSNLRLTAATVTITPRDSVTLVYNTTNNDWVQVVTLCAVV